MTNLAAAMPHGMAAVPRPRCGRRSSVAPVAAVATYDDTACLDCQWLNARLIERPRWDTGEYAATLIRHILARHSRR